MAQPEISVIVPVYNARAHLDTLLSSLLCQSERSLQIVAVDDGSNDGSLGVLQCAAAKDARLVVLTRANRGASAARNVGLAHARGRWIGFADSDDWLDPRALETWRKHGDRTDVEVVLGNGFPFSETPAHGRIAASTPLVRQHPPSSVFTGGDWIKHCVQHSCWAHFVWLQLIRRDVLLRHSLLFDETATPHEDILWSMHLGLRAQRMSFAPELLYGYRIHPNSMTHDPQAGALYKRALGYVVVIQKMLASAAHPETDLSIRHALIRHALIRHAQREGRNLFGIMNGGGLTGEMRRDIARNFVTRGLGRAMFAGADNARSLWRAVRCWKLMRDCAHETREPNVRL